MWPHHCLILILILLFPPIHSEKYSIWHSNQHLFTGDLLDTQDSSSYISQVTARLINLHLFSLWPWQVLKYNQCLASQRTILLRFFSSARNWWNITCTGTMMGRALSQFMCQKLIYLKEVSRQYLYRLSALKLHMAFSEPFLTLLSYIFTLYPSSQYSCPWKKSCNQFLLSLK